MAKKEPKKEEPKKEETTKATNEAPKEEKKVEKKEKKSQKERPKSKKKHTKVQIWKLYENGKSKNEYCPRCGVGVFIASVQNRKFCGRCSWSEVKSEKT